MKSKNISSQSGELLYYFNSRNVYCFDSTLAYQAIPNSKPSTVRELLSDMTRRGLLMRIKDGLYHIVPYEKNASLYMPEWHLLVEHLVGDANHYIGYYSALEIHNLITQPSLKEQIVVSKQIRPSEIYVKDVPFQFIFHNDKHFFGGKKIWIDEFEKVICSDLEKTIIDCLFKPEYAGGIVELSKALYLSQERINFNVLLDYAIRFNSQAVIKRLGFILELLKIQTPIINELQLIKSKSYISLDTELPPSGKRRSRWNIQVNLDVETILSAIVT